MEPYRSERLQEQEPQGTVVPNGTDVVFHNDVNAIYGGKIG